VVLPGLRAHRAREGHPDPWDPPVKASLVLRGRRANRGLRAQGVLLVLWGPWGPPDGWVRQVRLGRLSLALRGPQDLKDRGATRGPKARGNLVLRDLLVLLVLRGFLERRVIEDLGVRSVVRSNRGGPVVELPRDDPVRGRRRS
jgi:hypothetical protein